VKVEIFHPGDNVSRLINDRVEVIVSVDDARTSYDEDGQ
jgi:hypothetical protein